MTPWRGAWLLFFATVGCSRSELGVPGSSGIGGPTSGPPDPSFTDHPRAVRVATSGNDDISAVGSDWHGNVYFVAARSDGTDFTLTVIGQDGSQRDEHCPANDPTSEVMLAKLSPSGDCLWAHYFPNVESGGAPDVRMAVSPEGVVIVSTSSWWQTMSWDALDDRGQTLWSNTFVGPFARPNPAGGFVLFGYDATGSGQVTSINAAGDELWSASFGVGGSTNAMMTGFAVDDAGRALVAAEVSGVWSPTADQNTDVDTHGNSLSLVSLYTSGAVTTDIAREEAAIVDEPALEIVSVVAGTADTTFVVAFDADRSAELVALSHGAAGPAISIADKPSLPYGMVAHPGGTMAVGIVDDDPPDQTRVLSFDSSLEPVSAVSISPKVGGRAVLDSIARLPNGTTLVGGFFDVGAGDGSFAIDALGGDDGLMVWID